MVRRMLPESMTAYVDRVKKCRGVVYPAGKRTRVSSTAQFGNCGSSNESVEKKFTDGPGGKHGAATDGPNGRSRSSWMTDVVASSGHGGHGGGGGGGGGETAGLQSQSQGEPAGLQLQSQGEQRLIPRCRRMRISFVGFRALMGGALP